MNQPNSRNIIDDKDGIFYPVLSFSIFQDFSCGKADLDEYIRKDAITHKNELFAITYSYCLKQNGKISKPIAFVSLSNDAIFLSEKKRSKILPSEVNYTASPAVKIGRLGVDSQYQKEGFGSFLVDLIKGFFLTENRTGCRFLTVDAYRKQDTLRFYKKNGFDFVSGRDRKSETRTMYFDLLNFPLNETEG